MYKRKGSRVKDGEKGERCKCKEQRKLGRFYCCVAAQTPAAWRVKTEEFNLHTFIPVSFSFRPLQLFSIFLPLISLLQGQSSAHR